MNGDVIGSIIVLKIVFGLPVSPILDVLPQERSIYLHFIEVKIMFRPPCGEARERNRMCFEIETVHEEHVSIRIDAVCQFHTVILECRRGVIGLPIDRVDAIIMCLQE